MFGKRKLDELSVEELEKALLIKKRQARLERFQRLSEAGYTPNEALVGQDISTLTIPIPQAHQPQTPPVNALSFPATVVQPLRGSEGKKQKPVNENKPPEPGRSKKITDKLLLGLEVTAVVGLVIVLGISYFNLRELNDEVSEAQQNALITPELDLAPSPTPPIALTQLPGGHSPPTSPGGAVPDVPLHLQQWVQPSHPSVAAVSLQVEQQRSNRPTRLVIPKIKVDAPIVDNITWEDLKQGVGHLPGSAYPGERGNLFLAAHNDIYGEIFRYLDELEPGDEYFIYGGEQKFRYVVKEKRIIDPTDIEVMWPTTEPVATLQTCYPYLIDTHRLVVIGELAE
ncbi:MAG: class E sortase [Anaerolineae bacterium]|nr:class E sortase [Anaerolineae bacterium]